MVNWSSMTLGVSRQTIRVYKFLYFRVKRDWKHLKPDVILYKETLFIFCMGARSIVHRSDTLTTNILVYKNHGI